MCYIPRPMPEDDLLTKDDISRELNPAEPLSIRSVERYIELAAVEPTVKGKGRGSLSKYSRADVAKIVTAYRTAQEQQQQRRDGQASQALATTKPASVERAALAGEILTSQREGFETLAERIDSWPVWMSRDEAIARAGIPPSYFEAATRQRKGRDAPEPAVPHIGHGKARRFHRDDVRAFAERMREPGFIDKLTGKLENPT